jgi:hypothetical protein
MLRRVGVLRSDRRAATGLPLTPSRVDRGLAFLGALLVVNGVLLRLPEALGALSTEPHATEFTGGACQRSSEAS